MSQAIVKVEHLSHRYSVQWAANGFTFKTCLTEEELATAKFKIEMVMETGKTYSAADKTPSYGGIYALTLNEVQ